MTAVCGSCDPIQPKRRRDTDESKNGAHGSQEPGSDIPGPLFSSRKRPRTTAATALGSRSSKVNALSLMMSAASAAKLSAAPAPSRHACVKVEAMDSGSDQESGPAEAPAVSPEINALLARFPDGVIPSEAPMARALIARQGWVQRIPAMPVCVRPDLVTIVNANVRLIPRGSASFSYRWDSALAAVDRMMRESPVLAYEFFAHNVLGHLIHAFAPDASHVSTLGPVQTVELTTQFLMDDHGQRRDVQPLLRTIATAMEYVFLRRVRHVLRCQVLCTCCYHHTNSPLLHATCLVLRLLCVRE